MIGLSTEPPMHAGLAAIHPDHTSPEAVLTHEPRHPPATHPVPTRQQGVLDPRTPVGPVARLEDGTHLWESNAIQCYLAEGTPFLPDDRLQRAQVLQWMFFEQYSHEPYIAVVRFWHHSGSIEKNRAQLDARVAGGYAALGVMELTLARLGGAV